MKWLVIGLVVCMVGLGEGGALRCTPGTADSLCLTEEKEKALPQISTEESVKETATADAECLPGSEWYSKCHYCQCAEPGIASCLKQALCDDDFAEPIKCKANTTFTRGCSTCICLESGLGLCTLQSCRRSAVPKRSELVSGKDCAPGTFWRSQCNECGCSPSGYSYCTEKACPGMESGPELRCAPDTMWNNECNTCWCTTDGRALCTRMECFNNSDVQLDDNAKGSEKKPHSDEVEFSENHEVDDIDNRENDQNLKELSRIEEGGYNFEEHDENNVKPDYILKNFNHNLVERGHNLETLDHSFEVNDYKLEQLDHTLDVHDHNLVEHDKNYEKLELSLEEHDHSIEEVNHSFENNGNVQKLADGKIENHTVLKRSVCKPNQAFESECNSCKCASDGQSYTCTHNECMEGEKDKEVEVFMENEGEDHIEQHSVCKPRVTFYIGCNTCLCNPYGTDYSCTNKPCPLPEDVELFHELKAAIATKSSTNEPKEIVCVANRMFIKDCNTCWCNEDGTGFFCTRKACALELPDEAGNEDQKQRKIHESDEDTVRRKVNKEEEKPVLPPNQPEVSVTPMPIRNIIPPRTVRRIDTRDSISTENEGSLSRKIRGVTQEPAKTCQPGQEFRLDCNKCLCDNEGQNFSCTRNDCNVNNGNGGTRSKRETPEKVPTECSPGSVFDRDCNVCRCTTDGHHAMCTLKRCVKPQNNTQDNELNSPLPQSDPYFRCNPGEQFKRDCNDCSCSADGKSVFCTVLFCDNDITPPSV